jgi:hypothetical protein
MMLIGWRKTRVLSKVLSAQSDPRTDHQSSDRDNRDQEKERPKESQEPEEDNRVQSEFVCLQHTLQSSVH